MMDGTMTQGGAPAPAENEANEKETTVTCPNCGATLKLEVEEPEAAEGAEGGPSIREALQGAMGGQ